MTCAQRKEGWPHLGTATLKDTVPGQAARGRWAGPSAGGRLLNGADWQRGIPQLPAQQPEACRPVMASEWPLAGKGCPVELQTAVTMENLPSPPRQLPACLHARPKHLPPACRLQSPTASLTRNTAGSADLAPGRDSWCQAGQSDQLLI